jgi:hypothetical protein
MTKSKQQRIHAEALNPAATDAASEDDRRWFEAHPDESERIRQPFPGEVDGLEIVCTAVRVVQIVPGCRARMLIGTSGDQSR